MADIRYSTQIIDDFNRADEPYPPGILPPWYHTLGWDLPVHLDGTTIGSPDNDPNNQAMSSWQATWLRGDCETWGISFANANLFDGFHWGLIRADGAGYYIRNANSVGAQRWQIIRLDGPNNGTQLSQSAADLLLAGGTYGLIQLQGTTVATYWSGDAGANWTLMTSAVDNTYRDFLYPAFGAQGGAPGWTAVGAGPIIRKSQIYRRLDGQLDFSTP